jgi:hypothetical protein
LVPATRRSPSKVDAFDLIELSAAGRANGNSGGADVTISNSVDDN